jgi:N-hydroxyarylamine O-acetyltransferase
MDFPIDEYLERTGAESTGPPSVAQLEALQRAQIYAIPFENFDIQLGRGVDLTPEHLQQKLIRSRRGGYCFELNGLFLAAIRALGYEARALLGRVHISGEATGRGHQLSLVTIDGRDWAVDVGFGGGCPRRPLPLEEGAVGDHDGRTLRLVPHELGWMLQQQADGWHNLYSFDLTPVVPADIVYGNHFTSTHPSSIFRQSRIAVRAFPDRQLALYDFRCTTSQGDDRNVDELPDDAGYLTQLAERFGIELDAGYDALRPLTDTA